MISFKNYPLQIATQETTVTVSLFSMSYFHQNSTSNGVFESALIVNYKHES